MTTDRPAPKGRGAAGPRGSRRPPPAVRLAVVPVTPPRTRPVPLRRPDRAALARVAVISRRRTTDVTVHLGAIVLILSGLLSPLGTAVPAAADCGPSCGVTAAEAAAPGGAPDVPGADYPTPTGATPAPAEPAPPSVPAGGSVSAAALLPAAAVTAPAATAPAVTAPALVAPPAVAAPTVPAPAVTPPTVTGPTVAAPTVTTPAVTAAPDPAGAPSYSSVPIAEAPSTTTDPAPTTTAAAVPTTPSATSATSATPTTTPPATGDGVTAAATRNWGSPGRADEFTGSLTGWNLYDGPGHAGNGRRAPAAATVSGGVLTLSGDAAGTTAGMAWGTGARYGRWEGRVRAPVSDPSYHAVVLLWPDAENWPVGGEVDVMEMADPTRATTDAFLHYGAANSQLHGAVAVDATQWHNWAVEWAPDHITTFLDGVPWWTTSDRAALPPGPMHLCLQLDWFPTGRAVTPSTMQVDWVRYYPYTG